MVIRLDEFREKIDYYLFCLQELSIINAGGDSDTKMRRSHLSVTEVAEDTGIKDYNVRRLIRHGYLDAIKLGSMYLVKQSEIKKLKKKRRIVEL